MPTLQRDIGAHRSNDRGGETVGVSEMQEGLLGIERGQQQW